MGFARVFWKNSFQEAFLPKTSIVGQIVSEILPQLCFDDSIQILLNLTWVWIVFNANLWQVGVLEVALSEYLDKFHNFTNLIFKTLSL